MLQPLHTHERSRGLRPCDGGDADATAPTRLGVSARDRGTGSGRLVRSVRDQGMPCAADFHERRGDSRGLEPSALWKLPTFGREPGFHVVGLALHHAFGDAATIAIPVKARHAVGSRQEWGGADLQRALQSLKLQESKML